MSNAIGKDWFDSEQDAIKLRTEYVPLQHAAGLTKRYTKTLEETSFVLGLRLL